MRRSFEIRPGGAGDPEAARSAAVLAAYFHLEDVQDLRRLLLRQAALVGAGALLAALAAPGTLRPVLLGAAGAAAVVATGAAILEHRAASRLKALIHERQP